MAYLGNGSWVPDTLANTPKTLTSSDRGGAYSQPNQVYQTLLSQAPQSQVAPWIAPKLVNGNQFQSQADVDAFKAALHPTTFGWNAGSEHATGAGSILSPTGKANADAAMKWGTEQGFIPRSDPSGLPGLHSFSDFMQNWAPIIAVAAPAIGGVGFGVGAGAGGSAATGLGEGAVAGGSVGAGSVAGAGSIGAGAGGALGAAESLGAVGSATELSADQLLAQSAAGLSPTGAAETASLLGAGTATPLSATAIPSASNNLGTAQAVDPIAAPSSEALPAATDVGSSPGSAGIGAGSGAPGGTSPSTSLLTSASDMIGHINTFAQGALAIGGLLGGLAGLQGGKSPGTPESPPPLPEATQVGSQADAKNGLQAAGMPGGPLAGNASTWLTGASGVDPDKLNLGRSTLLGQ